MINNNISKEDIESLGFVFIQQFPSSDTYEFKHIEKDVYLNLYDNYLVPVVRILNKASHNFPEFNHFNGRIESKSELAKILPKLIFV